MQNWLPKLVKSRLSKEAFEEIAKEYLLAEAIVERLSRIIAEPILYALLKNIVLDLSELASANESAE